MVRDTVSLHETPTGLYWLPDRPTDHVISTIASGYVFDLPIIEEMMARTPRGGVVLDVGSNFGQATIMMSKHVGPSGRIYAFEADPWIFSLLNRNVQENSCRNVWTISGAVWDSPGERLIYPEADFSRFDSYGSYGIDPVASTGRSVPSITIDQLDLPRVDLIKIDVQGADLRAILGASRTIRLHRPIVIFEHETLFDEEFGVSWLDYQAAIDGLGYTITKTILGVNHVIEAIPS